MLQEQFVEIHIPQSVQTGLCDVDEGTVIMFRREPLLALIIHLYDIGVQDRYTETAACDTDYVVAYQTFFEFQ